MAGATIKIDIDDARVQLALSRVARIASDARPLFTEIGSALEASTRRRFNLGLAPDGDGWVGPCSGESAFPDLLRSVGK